MNNYRRIFLLLIASLSAYNVVADPGSTWREQCYKSFDRDVSFLAGPSAIDCGFLPRKSSKEDMASIIACAKKAVKSSKAFKFGYFGAGDDSSFCDVAVRTPKGDLVSLYFDNDVTGQGKSDGADSVIWASNCKKIVFEPGTISPASFFHLIQCKESPELSKQISSSRQGASK